MFLHSIIKQEKRQRQTPGAKLCVILCLNLIFQFGENVFYNRYLFKSASVISHQLPQYCKSHLIWFGFPSCDKHLLSDISSEVSESDFTRIYESMTLMLAHQHRVVFSHRWTVAHKVTKITNVCHRSQ